MADDCHQKRAAGKQRNAAESISRRSLFGSTRSEDTDEWLQDLEQKMTDEKVQKWSFDFREDKPLANPDDPDVPSPSHVYEAVDANDVPAFYRSRTVAESTSISAVSFKMVETPRKRRVDKPTRTHSPNQPRKLRSMAKKEVDTAEPSVSDSAAAAAAMVSPRKRLRKMAPVEDKTPKKSKMAANGEEDGDDGGSHGDCGTSSSGNNHR